MRMIYTKLRNFIMDTLLGYTSELPPEIQAQHSALYELGRDTQNMDYYQQARLLASRNWRWVKRQPRQAD